MSDQRVSCPRKHLLFKVTSEGISIKCRGCRDIHIVAWDELLEAMRVEAEKPEQEIAEKSIA